MSMGWWDHYGIDLGQGEMGIDTDTDEEGQGEENDAEGGVVLEG